MPYRCTIAFPLVRCHQHWATASWKGMQSCQLPPPQLSFLHWQKPCKHEPNFFETKSSQTQSFIFLLYKNKPKKIAAGINTPSCHCYWLPCDSLNFSYCLCYLSSHSPYACSMAVSLSPSLAPSAQWRLLSYYPPLTQCRSPPCSIDIVLLS